MKARSLLASFILCAGTNSFAQTLPPTQNVLQLQASSSAEVQQDLLTLRLATAREGTDAALVQNQLTAAVDAALAEARKSAQTGLMEVRTGRFGLYPRHNRDGKLTGWTGSAELVLEGRDFTRITQSAARMQTMTVSGLAFGLSREQRSKVESEAQSAAIERFKQKAGELARGFGFSSYTLREVAVNASDNGHIPLPRMAMESKVGSLGDGAVPVEAGKSTVVVTVSGSVQLR